MLNNSRICPSCRSPLATNTCKKCGYKQKILKVAEFQEEFGKINYANKIQSANRESKAVRSLTAEEKLAIYLKQYQKLIIKAVEKIIEANQLNISQRQQFKNQVKTIWQTYLLKIRTNNHHSLGILKKPLDIQPHIKQSYKMEEQLKKDEEIDRQNQKQELQKIEEYEEHKQKKKRGRPNKSIASEKKQITMATKLRCYINISVKPLIQESIQARKDDLRELTTAQKSFLSFLLGLREIDQEFLLFASNKYLRLLLEIDGNKQEKSFVKQSVISNLLKRRNLDHSKDRNKALFLIMLFDTLQCLISATLCEENIKTMEELMRRYRNNESNSVIDILLVLINKQKRKGKEEQYIPEISYQLIYSIMHVSSCLLGLTLSIGEIMASIGGLQISRINLDQDVFLAAILNQQVITPSKIRRTAHLLAKYLDLTFPVVIGKWCRKWCAKFDIMPQLPKICALNRAIFMQVFKKGIRKRPNHQYTQKYHNYFRFYQLEQDIASLSSLLVYLKLADGLTDYPYLLNINIEALKKQFSFDEDLLNSIEKLMKHKKINVQNTSNKEIVTKIMPQMYQVPFDLLKFSKKVMQINRNDKLLSNKTANRELIKFRNLSHLNEVPSLQLLEIFKRFKASRGQKEQQNQIKLRYNEIPHQQWTYQLVKSRKTKIVRIVKQKPKPKAILSEDLIKQMTCIINYDETVVAQQGSKKIQCLVDQPSTNYQLMYDYSSDNLTLVQRCQQLHLMQQLCLNVCNFGQMVGWLNTYQSILKRHQTK